MRIVCVGSSSKDIFFPTPDGVIFETPEDLTAQKKIVFELGAKFHIETRYEALGGCAANVACGLKKLGLEVACYTTIGDDLIGSWILNEFKNCGVGTELVSVEKGCSSDLSAIIVDEHSGERIIFTNQTANKKLEINEEKISGRDWIFIGDLNGEWRDKLDKILDIAQSENLKIAFNPRQKIIHDDPEKIVDSIKKSKVLLLNKDESIEIVSSLAEKNSNKELNDEEYLIKKVKNLGPEFVALTDGKRGAWAFDGKDLFFAPALGVDPVETTGAGDAFSSGFLGALIQEKSLEEALKWGIVNSGNSVKFFGAIGGLLDRKKITERIKGVNANKIKTAF